MTPFKGENFVVHHGGHSRTVRDLSGFRCGACKEVIFDGASAKRYSAAGSELVLQERERQAAELKRIRVALKLSQKDAAAITGGGHNAFSRYESGKAVPMLAIVNLLRILDRHPELLKSDAVIGAPGFKLDPGTPRAATTGLRTAAARRTRARKTKAA
jgi:HTH-type transcriptional regulator/antitoxin MqsA